MVFVRGGETAILYSDRTQQTALGGIQCAAHEWQLSTQQGMPSGRFLIPTNGRERRQNWVVSAPALPDSARELIPADQIKRAESNASLSLHLIGERTDIIDGAAQDCAF